MDAFWFFWGMAQLFVGWRDQLRSWANSIQGYWIVGPHLAAVLRWFASAFDTLRWKTLEMWQHWNELASELRRVANVDRILDTLFGRYPLLRSFLDDPVYIIGLYIPRAYGTSPLITRDLVGWLDGWLQKDFYRLWQAIHFPNHFFDYLIWRVGGPFYQLYRDWRGFFNTRIPRAPGFHKNFLDDPWGWLDDWIYSRANRLWWMIHFPSVGLRDILRDYFPPLYQFFTDPIGYIRERMLTYYGSAMQALEAPTEYLDDTLRQRYPEAYQFFQMPGTYVWCKLKEYLDSFIEAEVEFIQRIATRVLSALW